MRVSAPLLAFLLLVTACRPAAVEVGALAHPAIEAAAVEPPAAATIEPEPDPRVAAPGPPPASRVQLASDLDEVLIATLASLDAAELSVLVVDGHGREVIAHRPEDSLLPASTLKVVTAAAALVVLGPQTRLATHVEATGPLEADGTLHGDLVLVGGGDPALATDEYIRWVYPARPATPLSVLADAVADAGVVRVTGDVVGIAPGFEGPSVAEGWLPRYFWDFDARHASGLTVDAGLVTSLRYELPDDTGQPDRETADAAPPEIQPGDGTEDLAANARPPAPFDVPLGDRDIEPDEITIEQIEDPARHAAAELARMLLERGVDIDGAVRAGTPRAPQRRLASVESDTVEQLVRFSVEFSDNHLADGLLHTVALARQGRGSFDDGARALEGMLDALGVDRSGAVFADGSGLSRDDRLSVRTLVDLDVAMHNSPHADAWRSVMAVMGETGTLRRRLTHTVAHERFVGKTGSLRDVVSISGTVGQGAGEDADRRFHVALIANDALGDDRARARILADELILLLAADLEACQSVREVDVDEPNPLLPLGELVISC